MRIDSITKEQIARFPEWAKKWIEIGLSTEPADFDKATDAALRAYKLCNLNKPMVILRMSSPYGATVGGALAWLSLREASRASGSPFAVRDQVGDQVRAQVRAQVRDQVWAQVWAQVGDQVRDQVGDQVRAQVGDQVRAQVGDQVWAQVWAQVGDQVRDQVGDQVRDQVWAQVRDQVGDQVRAQVGDQVWAQVWAQVGDQVRDQVRAQVWAQVGDGGGPLARAAKDGFNNYSQGAFWANWAAYVTFIRDVLGLEDPVLEKFQISEDLTKACGWVWWHENICVISDRPSEIHRDEQGRLHNDSGPSIAYRDGWALHHWHGVVVPKQVIEQPETITVAQVEAAANAEVRRVMVQRMGMERFITASNLKPIHSDDFGTLYRKEQSNDEALVVVKVRNSTPEPDGSVKDYFLRVPPTITKAREAVAWTFDLKAEEYLPAIQT